MGPGFGLLGTQPPAGDDEGGSAAGKEDLLELGQIDVIVPDRALLGDSGCNIDAVKFKSFRRSHSASSVRQSIEQGQGGGSVRTLNPAWRGAAVS